MLSQTSVFTQTVRDQIEPFVLAVEPTTAIADVVARLRETASSAAVITNSKGGPAGILTERDVCRRVAFSASPSAPVAEFMSAPVHAIDEQAFLHQAVAWMRQDHIRHLPVLTHGRVVGLLELEKVLSQISGQTVAYIDLLRHEQTQAGMREAKQNQIQIATQLLAEQVPAPEIQQLLTRLNHQLYRDAAALVLKGMSEAGFDPAPVPFEVIIMGSGGRGENYLIPDQDNGLLIADYPDSEHTRIDAWFIEFSSRLVDSLADIGFDYCHGNVMAVNPLWRKTLSQWRQQISGWIRKSEGQVLRLCDIFFDFTCVYGSGDMSAALRAHIVKNAPRLFFLREMFKIDEEHDVALGPFGILLPDRRKGPHKGKLNLKITGTLPLVGVIRLMALRERIAATSTLDRIAALYEWQVLSKNEEDDLRSAFQHITFLLLRQQLLDAKAEREPSNHIAVQTLSKRERKLLVTAFKAIRALRSRLRSDLTGEIF